MKYITLAAATLVLGGCQTNRARLVCENSRDSALVITPAGFGIPPNEAYMVVREAGKLSPKHVWHCYADDQNYYIIDSFLGSSSKQAIETGVIIDGQTGEIVN